MLCLLFLLVLIAVSLTQTTPVSQTNALNNLAALESAEEILKTIDDLTTFTTPATSLPVTTEMASTMVEVTTNVLLEDRRRVGGGGIALPMQTIYNTDSGLRALMEIKQRMQNFLKNPTVNSALNRHVFTIYGVPRQSLYLNNAFQPQMEVATPSYVYNPVQQGVPLQYAKLLQNLPVYANFEPNIRKENDMNVVQYSQIPQIKSEVTLPSQPMQRIRPAQNILTQNIPAQNIPAQNIPAQNIPAQATPIPMWMLLALQEIQGRRPMDSPSVVPRLSEALYPQDVSLPTADSPDVIEAAIQEANAKAISMSKESQQPEPLFPTLYIPPPTEAPLPFATQTRGPTVIVTLPPITMAPQSPKKTRRPKNHLQVNPLLPANAWMSLQALASVKTRLVTQPRASSSSRLVLNFQSRLAPRLPTTARNRLVSVKSKPPAESLFKLTKFMRENRDTLLQFIAMKRNLLLEQKKGTIAHGNAYQNTQTQIRNAPADGKRTPIWAPNIAALIQNSNRASGNVIEEKIQAVKVKGLRSKGDGTNLPAVHPVARALPQQFPGHMLDLAPGKGSKIRHMRFKNRICQRSVMQVSGPKYDRKARVIKREFRPGVDGRVFRVTRRKKMLLPACCNCCKKSVLGCE